MKEIGQLPLKFEVSFEKVYSTYSKYAKKEYESHPNHMLAKSMEKVVSDYPQLITGVSDLDWLDKNKKHVDVLLEPLFPEALSENEIKAVAIPFLFKQLKYSARMERIIKAAGRGFHLEIEKMDDDVLYILTCVMILGMVHNYHVDLKRPFFFNIPDAQGQIKNYRVAFNADMAWVEPTDSAPKITEEDYKLLLDSFENIEVWKEKFPPNSYIFKGFGIMNLFDVTSDESISSIRTNLLKGDDDNFIQDLGNSIRRFYNINDLLLGFSVFDLSADNIEKARLKKAKSLVFEEDKEVICTDYFCEGILKYVMGETKPITISDSKVYSKRSNNNPFSKHLISKKIGSIMLIPIKAKNGSDLAILEIASPRPYEMNSISLQKLADVIPMFEYAVERASKEMENAIEATIQERYTAIHPSVKWKFSEAVEKLHKNAKAGNKGIKLEEIVFEEVFPLFGQADIKGSSVARNLAIQEDLSTQLSLAKNVLKEALKSEKLPIYEELIFRINEYMANVKEGLKAGDEVGILDFLKRDIYPVFSHLGKINRKLSILIDGYMDRLDKELNVIYEKRKAYESSVTLLNDTLAKYIDQRQEEAQAMFPHYFERYKTDGVEHNIYIGQSLVKNKTFDPLYLHNLRLWQLQVMYEMENLAYNTISEMEHELRVASMILVHSNPLAIKFRMDEKQFDVDGAYNIRYAIIKKRIDKANIKGTENRVTVPGKIAIIYSQDKDAEEYMKYLKFLQSKNIFGEVERLQLEDLQGVSGLKALRVEVIYQKDYDEKSLQAMDELIQEIQS